MSQKGVAVVVILLFSLHTLYVNGSQVGISAVYALDADLAIPNLWVRVPPKPWMFVYLLQFKNILRIQWYARRQKVTGVRIHTLQPTTAYKERAKVWQLLPAARRYSSLPKFNNNRYNKQSAVLKWSHCHLSVSNGSICRYIFHRRTQYTECFIGKETNCNYKKSCLLFLILLTKMTQGVLSILIIFSMVITEEVPIIFYWNLVYLFNL